MNNFTSRAQLVARAGIAALVLSTCLVAYSATAESKEKAQTVSFADLDLSKAAGAQQAQTAVDSVSAYLDIHSSTTERLEGDIDLNGERASLILIQIPKAADGNRALLCVRVRFDSHQLGGSANPDGTGGGTSVRT